MALEQEHFFTSGVELKSEDSIQINVEGIFTLCHNFFSGTWHLACLGNKKGTYVTYLKAEKGKRYRDSQDHT